MAGRKKEKEPWWILHCTGCKTVVEDMQKCCGRYLCDSCHMKQCLMAPKQAMIADLKLFSRGLHIALLKVLAGETIPPETLENLNENVLIYLGPNYEDVKEQK